VQKGFIAGDAFLRPNPQNLFKPKANIPPSRVIEPKMDQPGILALDAMGGDRGAEVVVAAALGELEIQPGLELILVGPEDQLTQMVAAQTGSSSPTPRLHIHHAPETVTMADSPISAVRNKKHSSMRMAIDLVRDGRAQACVSAGNTGALMVTAKFVLKTLKGIDRPAICAAVPTRRGQTLMLDLGANSACNADHLMEFAIMGAALASSVYGVRNPSIGLLNIGTEEIKGNGVIKRAHELLSSSTLNYQGFLEGGDISQGRLDVIVADGFAGNVALKTMEGTAQLIAQFVQEEFRRNVLTQAAGLLAFPIIRSLRRRLDPRQYNGASFLGINGIVVKSHGNVDALGFRYAIRRAFSEVQNQVPQKISRLQQEIIPPVKVKQAT